MNDFIKIIVEVVVETKKMSVFRMILLLFLMFGLATIFNFSGLAELITAIHNIIQAK